MLRHPVLWFVLLAATAAIGWAQGAAATSFAVPKVAAGNYTDFDLLPGGDLLASDQADFDHSGVVWRIRPDGSRERWAGVPTAANDTTGDGGPALAATFHAAPRVAVGDAGVVFLGDWDYLRRVDPDGSIRTVTTVHYSNELVRNAIFQLQVVPGSRVMIYEVYGYSMVDPNGTNLRRYLYDFSNRYGAFTGLPDGTMALFEDEHSRLMAVSPTGTMTPIAGVGKGQADGDALTVARFDGPLLVASPAAGVYVVAEQHSDANGAIRLVQGGMVTTIAQLPWSSTSGGYKALRIGAAGVYIGLTDGIYLLHKTQLLSGPRDFTDAPTARFAFGSYYSGPTFQCRIDGSAWSACASPFTAGGLADGPHDFAVRATDAYGTDPNPATSHFVVDTTGPNTVITDRPSAATQRTDASFSFDSPQAGATFDCRLDGGAWAACTSPKGYTALANGPHTFAVRATTADGHPDPTPAELTWTVDTVAPTATLTQSPPTHVAARTAGFAFTSADGGTGFECRLDGGPFAACTSPVALDHLADGAHTFDVRALDAAGNVQAAATRWSWTVDPSPPDTSFASTPALATPETTAVFDLASDELGVTYSCAFDETVLHACSATPSAVGLAEGEHVFRAAARDAAGNVDPTPAEFHWVVDRVAPSAPALVAPAQGRAGVAPGTELRFTAGTDDRAGIATHVVTLDGHALAPVDATACAAAASCAVQPPAPLAGGVHQWAVTARDRAGNATTSAAGSFTVDDTPPTGLGLQRPADGERIGAAQPELRWEAAADPGSGVDRYEVRVDGGAPVEAAGTSLRTVPLGDGVHTWSVVAVDGAGNRTAAVTRAFRVDTTAPVAMLRVSPTRFVPPYELTVDAGSSTDADGRIVHYEFDLDGDGSFETPSDTPRVTTLASTAGLHVVGVRVTDEVGLTAVSQAQATGDGGRLDPGPRAAYVSIDAGARYTRDLDVTLEINPPPHSGAVKMVISNDGKPDETQRRPITGHVAHWLLDRGDATRDRRTVYVSFYNSAGFEVTNGRVQDDVLYDPYPPVIAAASLRTIGPGRQELRLRVSDHGSGLKGFELRSGKRVLLKADGVPRTRRVRLGKHPKKLAVVVRDKAGNTARATVRSRR